MENNCLRGLFAVSSPRPVEQRVAPQPTEPIENETPFEFLLRSPIEDTPNKPLKGLVSMVTSNRKFQHTI